MTSWATCWSFVEQALKYGVAASDEDAEKRLETLPLFQKEGKFDPAAASMMEDRLRADGFGTGDLLDLVKDQLVYERLQDLVGANYSPSAQAVTAASRPAGGPSAPRL